MLSKLEESRSLLPAAAADCDMNGGDQDDSATISAAVTKIELEDEDWSSILPPPTPILTQWTWRQLVRLPTRGGGSGLQLVNGPSSAENDGDDIPEDSSDKILNELSVTSWWNIPRTVKLGKFNQSIIRKST